MKRLVELLMAGLFGLIILTALVKGPKTQDVEAAQTTQSCNLITHFATTEESILNECNPDELAEWMRENSQLIQPSAPEAACVNIYTKANGNIPAMFPTYGTDSYVEYWLKNNCDQPISRFSLSFQRTVGAQTKNDYRLYGPACLFNSTSNLCNYSFNEYNAPYWDSLYTVEGLIGYKIVQPGEEVYLFYQWLNVGGLTGCVNITATGTVYNSGTPLEWSFFSPPVDAGNCVPGATPTPWPTNTPQPTATNTPQPGVTPTPTLIWTATPQPTPTADPDQTNFIYLPIVTK